jgi:O-antigen ligase
MRGRLAGWAEKLSVLALAGLLLTLPSWRHRVLLHRAGEPLFFEFRDITLYTNDLCWLGAIGAWLLSRVLRRDPGKLRLGPWFVTVPLLGFCLLAAAGIPVAIDPFYTTYQTGRLLLLFLLYLMLINAPFRQGAVAWPLAAGLLLQATVALPQFLLGRSLGLERLGEVTVQAAWPGAGVVMVGEERWLRAYGLAQHPNMLAGCLMMMLLVVCGYYLLQRGWRRLLLLLALASGTAALLLTFSRASWLGILIGGGLMAVLLLWAARHAQWLPSRAALAQLAVILMALGMVFVLLNWRLLQPRLGLTTQGTEIRSLDARKMQVPAALALIQERPILGVGLGSYPMALYRLARDMIAAYPVYQPVYSVPLLVTAELGAAGGLLWLSLLASPWPALYADRRRLRMTPWWAGLSGALAALAVVNFLDFYVWTSHQGRLALWLVLGLWAREWQGRKARPDRTRHAPQDGVHVGTKIPQKD